MTFLFSPQNWYWKVGGSTAQVYSSASNSYVPIADATYVAWLAAGNLPTPIGVEADIWMYVSAPPRSLPAWLFNGTTFAQPTPTTFTAAQLAAYTAFARYNKEISGITISGMAVATDRASQAMINGAYSMALQNSAFTTMWKLNTPTPTFVSLNAVTIIAVAIAVGAHVAACFAAEASIDAAITAGTTTTTAQIDTAMSAVTP